MRKIKWVLISAVLLYLLYFVHSIFLQKKYGFEPNYGACIKYKAIFSDTLKTFLRNDLPCISYVNKTNMYTDYVCKNGGKIVLWKFESLGDFDLDSISFHENEDTYNTEILTGETLSYKTDRPVTVAYRLSFDENINVNLSLDSKVYKYWDKANYKGFQGKVRRLVLENSIGEPQIILNSHIGTEPATFFIFKRKGSLYFIYINVGELFCLDLPDIIK